MAHGLVSERGRPRPRLLTGAKRDEAVARLARSARRNLMLLDVVASIGRAASPYEVPAQAVGAFDGDELCGVVALRPSLVLEAELDEGALDLPPGHVARVHDATRGVAASSMLISPCCAAILCPACFPAS